MDNLKLAGCVILNKVGDVLLLHRNTANRNQWETPGGKVEVGENTERTAEREAEEEIGVNIEIIRELGRKDFIEDTFTMNYIWYLAKIKSGLPKIMENKFDDLKYLSWNDLQKMMDKLSPNTQNLVNAYFVNELAV